MKGLHIEHSETSYSAKRPSEAGLLHDLLTWSWARYVHWNKQVPWLRVEALSHIHGEPPAPSPSASTLQIFRGCYVLVVKSKINHHLGSPGGAVVKNPLVSAGDTGLFPGSGRSPGGGNGNPLQYSCLENPMDRGAWWATVQGVKRVEQLSMQAHTQTII